MRLIDELGGYENVIARFGVQQYTIKKVGQWIMMEEAQFSEAEFLTYVFTGRITLYSKFTVDRYNDLFSGAILSGQDLINKVLPKGAVYDDAIPQRWLDGLMDSTSGVSSRDFVWLYDKDAMFGRPFPLTELGMKALHNVGIEVAPYEERR